MSFILLGILNSQAEAAGGAPAYDLLETTIVSGTTTSAVSFTGLGSYTDYKHLQVRMLVSGDPGDPGANSTVLTLNNDVGANYSSHQLHGDGSSARSRAEVSDTNIRLYQFEERAGDNNVFGSAILDFLDFSNSNKNTTVRWLGGVNPASASDNRVTLGSGLYMNTNAITSITFTSQDDFVPDSRFSLYGIKG